MYGSTHRRDGVRGGVESYVLCRYAAFGNVRRDYSPYGNVRLLFSA